MSSLLFKIRAQAALKKEYKKIINLLEFDKSFDVDLCTKEELINRCAELNFSKENTDLAIKFFIEKTKQSEIADELCIDEKSVQTRKRRLKQKLNTQM
jgi:hypothetical protein